MAGKQSRGRQKIPIRRIESQDNLYVTFSKRRLGLYKKASELSTLCGVDIGIIIFSPTGNPFSFWHPSMESVIHRYRNPVQPLGGLARVIEDNTRARIGHMNKQLDEVKNEKDKLKEREKQLDETGKTQEKVWWEQIPIESLDKDQVNEWKALFQDFNSQVKKHIEELKNRISSSSTIRIQNAPNFPSAYTASALANPSMFPQEFSLGSSYAQPMGLIGPSDQFPGHYYDVHRQAQVSRGPYNPFLEAQTPASGGSVDQFASVFNYFPPHAQDPSSTLTADQFAGSFNYFPTQAQDPYGIGILAREPSTGGGREGNPSHQTDTHP